MPQCLAIVVGAILLLAARSESLADEEIDLLDSESGQDQIGWTDVLGGERGENHVEFAIGESGDGLVEDRGNGHINFSIAPDGGFSLVGEFLLADREAEIVAGIGAEGDNGCDFRIAIQPDGRVDVNGQEFAACDPAEGCRLSLAWSSGTSTLVVQVERADGSLAAGQFYVAEAPTEITVQAAEIRALSITPQ